ncbi:hypothetical protein PGTUg99_034647 [Puccinia graminis f. sp. tritici]|uniref:Uncharacterized protein n=1 Tax=Puccinia graminis f. sp. tritici TaxID=56615 RepID=A0A5B0PPS4_PUCGR|nr:hypothetical protein PGTUg99_034647 [Puccinia graminis f. sp. tritici]
MFQENEDDVTLMDSVKELADVVATEESSALSNFQELLADHMFCQPSQQLHNLLREAYEKDPPVEDNDDESPMKFDQGFWCIKDRIFVPLSFKPFMTITPQDTWAR